MIMDNVIISFNQVCKKYYSDINAIENLSLTIKRGELVFLAGPSGAGKSTILKLIAGIEPTSEGTVVVNNINLSKTAQNHRTFIRQHIGFIFQDHKILFDRNVFDNVRLPLDLLGYSYSEIKSRTYKALEHVGLAHKIKSMPQQLSGGEQQRLCIARAVVHRPKILLADEPTANLDRENALKILELLKMFHQSGVTIVISAHDESLLNDYGKRIIRINNGQFRG
jgi:cell division transport system ATP-binding protein